MKIKNIQKSYVDIKIKYGPSFEYELPESYEQFKEDLLKKGYPLSKGELSYLNSHSQKIIIKSRNDFISLLNKVRESKLKIKLVYEKELIDSFIADIDFINIPNVFSDLNTDETILELSQSLYNTNLNAINEIEDKEYYSKGINVISILYKKKYFLELIIKIDGKDFFEKKFGKKDLDQIPKNKLSSSINLEYKIPSFENLIKKSKISLININDEILNSLYNQFQKLEDKRIENNNSIYQTMINNSNNSKLSLLKKEESNIINKKNKIYETDIIQNTFFYQCNNCHINPIKNKRYKCTKCINYNLCEKCEEENYQNKFHPHSEFIQIRKNENSICDNPYSYQCLYKNLVFNINKEDIVDDKIIIKNILIKNNFILPWPGNNETYLKCDKALSSIFCEKIFLPNLPLGNTTNIDFIFPKVNKMSKGQYKCICNFFVRNNKYGSPLELKINFV